MRSPRSAARHDRKEAIAFWAAIDWSRSECAAYTPISCEPLRRFLDHAEVGIFLDVEVVLEEADFFLLFEIVLQRAEVRRAVRIAILIATGEGPVHARQWRFVEPRDDGDRFIVILWIDVPTDRAHGVLKKINQCGAVLLDEVFAGRPHRELSDAEGVTLRK